jgi:hypothetical protein
MGRDLRARGKGSAAFSLAGRGNRENQSVPHCRHVRLTRAGLSGGKLSNNALVPAEDFGHDVGRVALAAYLAGRPIPTIRTNLSISRKLPFALF